MEKNNIKFDDFEITELINNSLSGTCMKVIEKRTGKLYIFYIYDELSEKNYLIKMFLQNFDVLSHLNHPAILKYTKFHYPIFNRDHSSQLPQQITPTSTNNLTNPISLNRFITSSKYPLNGTVFSALKEYLDSNGQKNQRMNPTIRSKIIFGVAAAMKFMHEHCIINRNLSLKNIFLDENFEPKIANYGFHFYRDSNLSLYQKDPYDLFFLAPEEFYDDQFDQNYDCNIDVYSFAFVIYMMFSQNVEFPQKIRSPMSLMLKVARGLRPFKPKLMPDCYWKLVCHCWDQDILVRPKFDEIVEILKDEKFAIEEFGMKTDIDQLRKYQIKVLN